MSSSSNDFINTPNEKTDVKNENTPKSDMKPYKRSKFSFIPQTLRNIRDNPVYLRKAFKPNFVIGILLGFSINYYFAASVIFEYLAIKETIMTNEIKQLKKEIKNLQNTQ